MKNAKRILSLLTALCLVAAVPILVSADELPAESMTYGQSLGSVQLLDASVSGVPGKWGWTDPSIKPEAGTAEYEATFTPADTDNYNPVTANISVTTLQAKPNIEAAPTAAGIIYGTALSESALESGTVKGVDGNVLPGAWAWKDGSVRPAAGTIEYTAVFTPTDAKNYTTAEANISVTISQSTVDPSKITPPDASEITFGQTLADSTLTGGSVEGVDGVWAWSDPTIKPNRYDNAEYSDIFTYAVVFTPTDTGIAAVTENINVKLNNAFAVIETAPAGAVIAYGQSLSDSSIEGGKAIGVNGEELAGSWFWTDAAAVPEVGTAQYAARFYPDSINYSMTTCDSVSVTVVKAAPEIQGDQPSAAEIVFGRPLSDAVITGTVSSPEGAALDGSWQWKDGTEVLPAGTHARTAVFTPADNAHYDPLEVTLSVTVAKKAVDPDNPDPEITITVPTASEITYRQTLADSVLSGGSVSGIDGTWAWADPAIVPPAGGQVYDVVFTPADTDNYEPFTVRAAVNVKVYVIDPEGTDTVELPTGSDITYGQGLADSTLTGGSVAGIAGAWSWADGTQLPAAGTQAFDLIFTPDDMNIAPMTQQITITIHKATPVLTEADTPQASDITYGQTIGDSILSAKE